MSIVVRPIKIGGGIDFVAGNDILAAECNGDANTLYTDHNGNIQNVNCAADMALVGSKLADSPSGITFNKLNDSAVTTAKINDLAVQTGKLDNLAVTGAKIAAATIIASKFKITTYDYAPGGTILAGATLENDTGLTATVIPILLYQQAASGFYQFHIIMNIVWNTTTNTWHILLANPLATNMIITTEIFKLSYVQAS